MSRSRAQKKSKLPPTVSEIAELELEEIDLFLTLCGP